MPAGKTRSKPYGELRYRETPRAPVTGNRIWDFDRVIATYGRAADHCHAENPRRSVSDHADLTDVYPRYPGATDTCRESLAAAVSLVV